MEIYSEECFPLWGGSCSFVSRLHVSHPFASPSFSPHPPSFPPPLSLPHPGGDIRTKVEQEWELCSVVLLISEGGGPTLPITHEAIPDVLWQPTMFLLFMVFLATFCFFIFITDGRLQRTEVKWPALFSSFFFSQLDEMTLAPLHAHPGSLRFPSICFLRHSILIKMADFFSGVQGKTTLYSHVCSVPSAAWGIFHSVMFSASM